MTFPVALTEDFSWVLATICLPVEVTGKQGPVDPPPVALPSEPGIESEQDKLEIGNQVRMRCNGPRMRTALSPSDSTSIRKMGALAAAWSHVERDNGVVRVDEVNYSMRMRGISPAARFFSSSPVRG
ncbi:MAG: hypothetical protein OSB12_10705 [Planctomycetota bacterium]|nr:hypothetical protein [Planctomycetota bacterium]